MALVIKDRVKVLATTTGTGDFTLGSAVTNFQDFSVIGDGNTTYYAIVAQATEDWEVGIGTYTAAGTTLSRDTVLESSNGGAAVDFPAGIKDVFVTYPAERSVYLDSAGAYPVQNTFNTLNAANAVLTAGTISTTPTTDTDIVNKQYVDNLVVAAIHYHTPVRVESPVNLTATYDNGTSGVGATLTNSGTQAVLVIDGITVSVNDRVLIYQQTDQTQNGIYVVTDVGSGSTNWVLTRAADADSYGLASPTELGEGSTVFVKEGNTGAGETYACNTVGTITFGTTNITFTQISASQIYSAGTGLTLTNTTFSLSDTGTAGTYGSASQVPVFTTNAQGQVTNVTNTAIAIAAGAVSGLAASATTDTTNASNITSGTLPTGRLTGSYTGITGVGTLSAGTWNGSTIAAAYGGTGFSSYTVGDILYADTGTTLAKLADVATGNALISGGVGAAPSWGKIGLATHVSGTLPLANGGTGQTSAQAAINSLAGATTSGQYLRGNGTNVVMSAIQAADVPTLNQNTTGNAATATALQTARTINGVSFNGTANITVTANTTSTLTRGSYLTGNNFNGSAATTWAVDATTTATASKVVARDANGDDFRRYGYGQYFNMSHAAATRNSDTVFYSSTDDFLRKNTSAGMRTSLNVPTRTGGDASGTWGISITGNAATATALQTARTINGVSFNGTANITVADSTKLPLAGGSMTGLLTGRSSASTDVNTANDTGSFSVRGSSTTVAAMSFHRTGAYAINMGLGTDNVFRIGGWSASANAFQLTGAGAGTFLSDCTAANILPRSDNTGVVGNSSLTWSNGQFTNLTIDGTLSVRAAIDLADNDVLRLGSSDDWEFFHNGTANYIDLNVGDMIVRDNTTTRFTFGRTTGNFTATGSVTANSDERLKKDWATVSDDFTAKLATIKAGTYTRIDTDERQAGVSAQDVQKILPEAVIADESGTLSLAYGNAAMVSVVELAKVIEGLKAEIADLKTQVHELGK